MKQFKLLAIIVGACLCFSALPVEAVGVWEACDPEASSAICGDTSEGTDIVKRLIETFLFVIGILSVIMIIHSGSKYVNSRGDPEGIKSAKNTLLYSVMGLVVAMVSFTLVNFVIGAF